MPGTSAPCAGGVVIPVPGGPPTLEQFQLQIVLQAAAGEPALVTAMLKQEKTIALATGASRLPKPVRQELKEIAARNQREYMEQMGQQVEFLSGKLPDATDATRIEVKAATYIKEWDKGIAQLGKDLKGKLVMRDNPPPNGFLVNDTVYAQELYVLVPDAQGKLVQVKIKDRWRQYQQEALAEGERRGLFSLSEGFDGYVWMEVKMPSGTDGLIRKARALLPLEDVLLLANPLTFAQYQSEILARALTHAKNQGKEAAIFEQFNFMALRHERSLALDPTGQVATYPNMDLSRYRRVARVAELRGPKGELVEIEVTGDTAIEYWNAVTGLRRGQYPADGIAGEFKIPPEYYDEFAAAVESTGKIPADLAGVEGLGHVARFVRRVKANPHAEIGVGKGKYSTGRAIAGPALGRPEFQNPFTTPRVEASRQYPVFNLGDVTVPAPPPVGN
jgi:hypothetical protein